ncbi:MAG TPA: hypothetical protein VG122_00810 [Gemmata sp.]|jgi:hypothetical protein|nr:hypothetical protein [Gemmata sp.]
MIRWLRVVIPLWGLAAVGTIYLIVETVYLTLEWRFRIPFHSFDDDGLFLRVMDFLAVIYALFRVWMFHPALRPAYCNWLSHTPWTVKKPLPFGPVHLVWQDVLLLSVAVGLCWPRVGIGALAVVKAFLGCYLGCLCFAHFYTGQKAWAYPIAFGLGFMILFVQTPLFFVFAGASYVIALLGLRASLAGFPRREESRLQHMPRFMTDSAPLGWPFGRLGPGRSKEFKLSDVFLTGLLAGWAVFVFGFGRKVGDMWMVGPIVFFAASARILLYCHSYLPPLSLLGRLSLGRLIIPGYDKVFIAPLLTMLMFVAADTLPFWSGVTHLVAVSIGSTMSWWILFGMGPSLDSWRLTGNHRIVKGVLLTGEHQKR